MRKLIFIVAALLLGAQAAQAQDAVADFYRGKRLFLQIGSETGGGYDLVGRAVARHMAKYIPGSPTIVVQNVVGPLGVNVVDHDPSDATGMAAPVT